MKTLILMLTMTMALAGTSNAHAFQVAAYANVSPQLITAEVYNNFPQPLTCRISVRGTLNTGAPAFATNMVQIPPGGYGYAYLNAWGWAYFINGYADANCLFL
jgi:hypothetical protein